MTSIEQVQQRIRDSLLENERRIFMQLIQDELPDLTLRELGEILTSPAARSVADLPVKALLGLAVAPGPVAVKPPRSSLYAKPRPQASATAHAAEAPAKPPRAARSAVAKAAPSVQPAASPAASPAPRSDESTVAREVRGESAEIVAAPAPQPAVSTPTIEAAPSGRSNVAMIQSIVSRALARHHRQDPDAQVLAALRGVGDWIRARDLRGRVELQPDELRATLNRLVKAGTVQRSGEGPDTVYLVGTGVTAAAP